VPQLQEIEKLEERLFQPKEVSEITKIDKESLRKYTEYFNIQTQWTQPNNKGHRRYTKENIGELVAIREKVKDQNWSWAKTLSWRNGETDVFITSHEEKSNLEKKMDQLLQQQQQMVDELELHREFTKKLASELDKSNKEVSSLKEYIGERLEKRDALLIESLKSTITEEAPRRKKFLGIF